MVDFRRLRFYAHLGYVQIYCNPSVESRIDQQQQIDLQIVLPRFCILLKVCSQQYTRIFVVCGGCFEIISRL